MFEKFNEAWDKEKNKGIKDNAAAQRYWDFLTQILDTKPEFEKSFTVTKKSKFQRYFNMIATNRYFDFFIMGIIVMNLVVMAMDFESGPLVYESSLDVINLIFTSIFISEAIIKILGLGFKGYFYYSWNVFDFFVVCSSLVDIVVSQATSGNTNFLKSFQIIRVLRLLRVTRVLRLVKSLKGLAKLLSILRWSIGALGNVFILLFLILCIFSIMGCYLYDGIRYKDYSSYFSQITEFHNFDNFYNSFLLSFRQMTGENWPIMMIEMSFGNFI
jgi:hypothetical protein